MPNQYSDQRGRRRTDQIKVQEIKEAKSLTQVLTEYVGAGKNVLWVIGLIVVGTAKFNAMENEINRSKESITSLREQIRENRSEGLLRQKEVSDRLGTVESKQNDQLVLLTEVKTLVINGGVNSSQRKQNGNGRTSNSYE